MRLFPLDMSDEEPFSDYRVTFGGTAMGQSSRNGGSFDFPDSSVTRQTSRSLDTVTSEMDDFHDIIGALMTVPGSPASSVEANVNIASKLEPSCEPDMGKSSGTKRNPDEMVLRECYSDGTEASEELNREINNRPKRTRSAELHNMSERRRRDRINTRLRTLQDLIPDCKKSDRASVLDDAVKYLKALKNQVKVISAGRAAILQASCMTPGGAQSTQVPQFSQYLPMRPKLGMASGFEIGMASNFYSPGLSMVSVPLAGLHPSLAAGVGFPLMSTPGNLVLPQVQVPLIHSQASPTYADTSTRLPNFFTGFSPAFNLSGQGESGSQAIPSTAVDQKQLQMRSQETHPSVSSSAMPASQKTTSSTTENVVSEASQFDYEAGSSSTRRLKCQFLLP